MNPVSTERTEQVRLPATVAARLRVIAAARRISMGELIEQLAGKAIETAYVAVIEAAASAHDLGGES